MAKNDQPDIDNPKGENMDFYRFWEILSENKSEWVHNTRSFAERPDSPPEHPTWEDKDLHWGEWEEDGATVRLVDGHFVDARNKPVPFLDQYASQVQGWDQTRGISLEYNIMYGTLPGREDPRTGESSDDENVRVELDKLALSDYKDPGNKIELPDSMIASVKAHFFKGYD